MFKIICTNCNKENNLTLILDRIDTDGSIVISNGDATIDYIECGCGNKIESNVS